MYFITAFLCVNLRYDYIDCRYSLPVSDIEILMKNNKKLVLIFKVRYVTVYFWVIAFPNSFYF